MSDLIITKKLNKTYGKGDSAVVAVNNIDLAIRKGEFTAIVGTSGSGKSTLMHLLGGVDDPTSGKVLIEGEDIFELNDEKRSIFRRRNIGFIFQEYNLVPILTVEENIVMPLLLDGNKVNKEEVDEL
nr:ATP-binding cassette domain-containing protein [Eubacterium sp.]